jgi:hypothetical protein
LSFICCPALGQVTIKNPDHLPVPRNEAQFALSSMRLAIQHGCANSQGPHGYGDAKNVIARARQF